MEATILFTIDTPEDISRQINTDYADLLPYRHSTLPPHISLFPPVKISLDHLDKITASLSETFAGVNPLEIELDAVDTFSAPDRVIYLKPHQEPGTASSLQLLRDLINQVMIDITGKSLDEDRPFEPHLTLAKQVPEDEFENLLIVAQEQFSPLDFTVDMINIYQLSPETGWEKYFEVKLG